jgi:antitoxin (DNA-binding transcriptional repressor) of toxin-antitoxin stability system
VLLPDALATVSIGELSRDPRRVLERILRGERLIVCRYGHPIATLQPLDGCVTQPFEGRVGNLDGSPLGDLETQLDELQPIEKELLMNCIRMGRIVTGGIGRYEGVGAGDVLEQWQLRGLARVIPGFGTFATARALVLREALLKRAGRPVDVIGLWGRRARGNPF